MGGTARFAASMRHGPARPGAGPFCGEHASRVCPTGCGPPSSEHAPQARPFGPARVGPHAAPSCAAFPLKDPAPDGGCPQDAGRAGGGYWPLARVRAPSWAMTAAGLGDDSGGTAVAYWWVSTSRRVRRSTADLIAHLAASGTGM